MVSPRHQRLHSCPFQASVFVRQPTLYTIQQLYLSVFLLSLLFTFHSLLIVAYFCSGYVKSNFFSFSLYTFCKRFASLYLLTSFPCLFYHPFYSLFLPANPHFQCLSSITIPFLHYACVDLQTLPLYVKRFTIFFATAYFILLQKISFFLLKDVYKRQVLHFTD